MAPLGVARYTHKPHPFRFAEQESPASPTLSHQTLHIACFDQEVKIKQTHRLAGRAGHKAGRGGGGMAVESCAEG